ncbi:hypothetical protein GOP47_0027481 [Adiantum capillus-veneris]|nr:hypothetical protein GOP47_0027481 [Adiantum capillus-veneris]
MRAKVCMRVHQSVVKTQSLTRNVLLQHKRFMENKKASDPVLITDWKAKNKLLHSCDPTQQPPVEPQGTGTPIVPSYKQARASGNVLLQLHTRQILFYHLINSFLDLSVFLYIMYTAAGIPRLAIFGMALLVVLLPASHHRQHPQIPELFHPVVLAKALIDMITRLKIFGLLSTIVEPRLSHWNAYLGLH